MPPRLFVALAACLAALQVAAEPKRPNVLLVMADDLGYSDLGCTGSEIRTPNLDALAANGLLFRQFYNGSRCCPTRASLLTGLYPHQTGVGDMTGDDHLPGYRGFPQPNTVTIAEVLKASGYHTSMVGKWHLSRGPKSPTPTERGFDQFFGMIGGFNSCFQEHPFYTRLPKTAKPRDYPAGEFYSTDAFGDYSLDFLAEARASGKPFFQYLAFNAPHFPLHAKPDDIAKYADTYNIGWDKLREERHAKQLKLGLIPPETPLSPRGPFETRRDFYRTGENPAWDSLPADRRADLARRMAVYAAMVDRMDATVGRVVADLKKHGQLDSTLILFLSDNGACAEWDPNGFDGRSGPNNRLHTGAELAEMGGPKSYMSYGSGWANASNTPLRLYKHFGHEGGIRTPMIAHWPAGIAARGESRDQAGHIIDVMATCLDVCGAKYPAARGGVAATPPEGVSLAPAFAGKPLGRDFLAWEHEGNRAARSGPWKLVAVRGGPWELYDLDADLTESRDLASAEPKRVAELAARWQQWATRCQVLPAPEHK